MHRAAVLQLARGLSARIEELRDELIGLQGLIAYDIDFPEEDEGPIPPERIDEAAAELTLEDSVRVRPIDVLVRAFPTEDEFPREMVPDFVPLWGSVILNANQQLEGYLVFETPAGLGARELRWQASDTALIRFE